MSNIFTLAKHEDDYDPEFYDEYWEDEGPHHHHHHHHHHPIKIGSEKGEKVCDNFESFQILRSIFEMWKSKLSKQHNAYSSQLPSTLFGWLKMFLPDISKPPQNMSAQS